MRRENLVKAAILTVEEKYFKDAILIVAGKYFLRLQSWSLRGNFLRLRSWWWMGNYFMAAILIVEGKNYLWLQSWSLRGNFVKGCNTDRHCGGGIFLRLQSWSWRWNFWGCLIFVNNSLYFSVNNSNFFFFLRFFRYFDWLSQIKKKLSQKNNMFLLFLWKWFLFKAMKTVLKLIIIQLWTGSTTYLSK